MKRITVTVADDVAKTILSLMIDEAISFTVSDVSDPAPAPHKTSNRVRRPLAGVIPDRILRLPDEFTLTEVEEATVEAGFKAQSALPALSLLKKAGILHSVERGVYRFTEKAAKHRK